MDPRWQFLPEYCNKYEQKCILISVNKVLLNSIIGVSLVGMIIIGIKDYLVNQKAQQIVQLTSLTPTPNLTSTVAQNIPPADETGVVCENNYIQFKPNKTLRYTLTTNTTTAEGKKTHTVQTVSTTMNAIATGSAQFTISLQNQKAPLITKILCKSDGFYWSPSSLLSSTGDKTALNQIDVFKFLTLKPFLLLPTDLNMLIPGSTWSSVVGAQIRIGGISPSFNIPITNTVVSKDLTLKKVQIESHANFAKKSFGLLEKNAKLNMFYELEQGIGITSASMEAKIAGAINSSVSLKRIK